MSHSTKRDTNLLVLVAIILAFVLIMFFIWLWYERENSMLERNRPTTTQVITDNNLPYFEVDSQFSFEG